VRWPQVSPGLHCRDLITFALPVIILRYRPSWGKSSGGALADNMHDIAALPRLLTNPAALYAAQIALPAAARQPESFFMMAGFLKCMLMATTSYGAPLPYIVTLLPVMRYLRPGQTVAVY